MIISHYDMADWEAARWPNFSPREVSCRHCGEMFWWPEAFDAIQRMREVLGVPVRLNSAHRCALHNAQVGGAILSMHKKVAFDVSLSGQDMKEVLEAAHAAGFTGFGFYGTFLHVDLGRRRQWSTKAGEQTWSSLAIF